MLCKMDFTEYIFAERSLLCILMRFFRKCTFQIREYDTVNRCMSLKFSVVLPPFYSDDSKKTMIKIFP